MTDDYDTALQNTTNTRQFRGLANAELSTLRSEGIVAVICSFLFSKDKKRNKNSVALHRICFGLRDNVTGFCQWSGCSPQAVLLA